MKDIKDINKTVERINTLIDLMDKQKTYIVVTFDSYKVKRNFYDVNGNNAQSAIDYVRSFISDNEEVINVFVESEEKWD